MVKETKQVFGFIRKKPPTKKKQEKKKKPRKLPKRPLDEYGPKTPDGIRKCLMSRTEASCRRWDAKAPRHKYQPFHTHFKTHPIDFIREHFYLPSSRGGKLIKLESFQEEILKGIFEKDPETGLRKHTLALVGTPKKSGKTTLAAAVALYFLCHEEDYGELLICANSKEQASWLVWKKLRQAIELHPKLREKKFIEVGSDTITCKVTKTVAKVLSHNYRTAAGGNQNLVIFDELWAYEELPGGGARKYFDELTTVPTRKEPLTLIVTYAGYEEDSLLWELYQKGLKVQKKEEGYDPKMYFYWTNDNLASWVTEEYLKTQRQRLHPNTYLRLHENRWVKSESPFISLDAWRACQLRGLKPALPDKKIQICVGVDVSISGDTTAVVACTRKDNKIRLVHHRIWKPTKKDRMDFENDVEAYILQLNEWFTIRRVLYDPYQFHRSATTLARQGIHMEEFPQTLDRLTRMGQNLYDLVRNQQLEVYYDKEIQRQVQSARAKETSRGFRIVKSQSNKKIDFTIGLAMAALGATEMPEHEGRPRIRVIDHGVKPDDFAWVSVF